MRLTVLRPAVMELRRTWARLSSAWKSRLLLWAVFALVFAGSNVIMGCGSSTDPSPKDFDLSQRIRRLKFGSSVSAAETVLGVPVSRAERTDEVGLNYGTWQLTFLDDSLKRKSKVVVPKYRSSAQSKHQRNALVRGMSPGMSVKEVRKVLGVPETVYVIYENFDRPTIVLRYLPWQITFFHGRLEQRSR